jgi:SAM-dependent methyltransferase
MKEGEGNNGDRFANIVDHYELWRTVDPDYDVIHDRLRVLVAQAISGISGPAAHVLEIGFGTGVTSRIILDTDPRVRLTAIDKSPAMMVRAREALESYGLAGRVRLKCGDVFRLLPRMDEQFPLIVSANTIHNLPPEEQAEAYRLIAEKLAPGGLFLSGDKIALDDEDAYLRLLDACLARVETLRGTHPAECDFFRNHEAEDYEIRTTEATLTHMLHQAGFSSVEISGRSGMIAIVSARK